MKEDKDLLIEINKLKLKISILEHAISMILDNIEIEDYQDNEAI